MHYQNIPFILSVLLAAVLFPVSATAQEAETKPAPAPRLPAPRIVGATPGFWAKDVNPSTGFVSLAFDQAMRPGFSAWAGPSALLPPSFGDKDRFSADLKTLSLEVKMEPGSVYVFGLNERGKSGVGFQNSQGTALYPHFLVFQTAGVPSPENVPPALEKAVPENFEMTVDPAKVSALSFKFDKPMHRDSHGVMLKAAGRPVDLAGVPFEWDEEGTTLTLNYQPKPNTLYSVTLNSMFNIGFRSEPARIPLWPVTLTFRTTTPSEPMENLSPLPAGDGPPMIVRSSPDFWDSGVDPAVDRITLKFDQPLRPGFSAWAGPGSIPPAITPVTGDDNVERREFYSSDLTTISLPVSLERGRIYVLSLNGRGLKGVGFQNAKGLQAAPTHLVFRTRGIPAQDSRPPQFRGMSPDPSGKIPPGESASISFAFDRPMSSGSQGLSLTKGGAPVDLKDASFTWDQTGTKVQITMPLEPETKYVALLNTKSEIGFRSATNIPLWPVKVEFETDRAPDGSEPAEGREPGEDREVGEDREAGEVR